MQIGQAKMSFGSEAGKNIEKKYNDERSRFANGNEQVACLSLDDKKQLLVNIKEPIDEFIVALKKIQERNPELDDTDYKMATKINVQIKLALSSMKDEYHNKFQKLKTELQEIIKKHNDAVPAEKKKTYYKEGSTCG